MEASSLWDVLMLASVQTRKFIVKLLALFAVTAAHQDGLADRGEREFTGEQAMQMPGLAEFRASLLDCLNRGDSKCIEKRSAQDREFAITSMSDGDYFTCKRDPKNGLSNTKEFSVCIFQPANKELKARLKYILETKKAEDFQADKFRDAKYPRVFIFHETGMGGIFTKSDKGWTLWKIVGR